MNMNIKSVLLALALFLATDAISRPVTIMGIGDSLTGRGDSYLPIFGNMLEEGGFDVEFIGPNTSRSSYGEYRQAGYSGKNAEYIAGRIEKVYSSHPADIVLLQCGHNNFAERKPVGGVISAYREMIETILEINPKARIFVAQIVESGKLPKYSYIPELNKELRSLVKGLGDNRVSFVKAAKGFDWKRHALDDKVHPNSAGSMLMAKNWYRTVSRYLKKQSE